MFNCLAEKYCIYLSDEDIFTKFHDYNLIIALNSTFSCNFEPFCMTNSSLVNFSITLTN